MLRRENLRFNPKQFGQVKFHSTIFRARNDSIDREQRLLELLGLAQAFRRRADEAYDKEMLARPVVRRCAGFDTDQTWRQLLEERQDIATLQLPASNHLAASVNAMNLEN